MACNLSVTIEDVICKRQAEMPSPLSYVVEYRMHAKQESQLMFTQKMNCVLPTLTAQRNSCLLPLNCGPRYFRGSGKRKESSNLSGTGRDGLCPSGQ